jgi:hypothetical protein
MVSKRSHSHDDPSRGRGLRAARVVTLALLLVAWPGPVAAQPAPTPEEVQQAQARWNEGKTAFDAGNFEAARVAFKQAYTVFPHPAFLQNLGEAELRTGRLVEAARHLSAYLRQPGPIPAAQRDLATRSLKHAAERLGAVVVQSDVEGAEVKVDDEQVGKTPLGGGPYYVEPGRHTVLLRKEGYADGTQSVDVAQGAPTNVTVEMRPAGAPTVAPPSSVEPSAVPAGAPASGPSHTREYVAIGGATLTVVGVVVGTVFAVKVGSDSDRQDELKGTLAVFDPAGGSGACLAGGSAATASTCSALAETAQTRSDHANLRNASFIAAGILGAATITTYLLWPRQSSVVVAPGIGPGQAGIGFSGTF